MDAAVEAGADAIGFVRYTKSQRYVTIDRAAELARRLPPFVTPVLLYVNEPAGWCWRTARGLAHALVQFHGDETAGSAWRPPATVPGFPSRGTHPAGPVDPGFDLVKYAQDSPSRPGHTCSTPMSTVMAAAGQTFNWSLLPPSVNCHLVLSGGLTPANVTDGILQVRPRCKTLAVDVSSGVELSKGIKDADKIHQFVAAVRAADEQLAKNFHVPVPAT